jgi:hypothetical protein
MKRIFALLFFAAVFTTTVNAQRFGSSTCGLIPGPCMERAVRQAYAPVDYMLNNYGYGYGGYGYGGYYGSGRLGTSALVGAASGAIAGGLVAYAATRGSSNRTTYAVAPDGGQYYAESQRRQVVLAASKPQKPLDCRKPSGKRGRNEAVCAAAEQEQARREAEARTEAERQLIANSPWRLYNRSGFTVEVFDGDRPLGRMRVNQSWRVLEPTSGFRAILLQPDFGGNLTEAEARIRPANDFQGWVITAPRTEE